MQLVLHVLWYTLQNNQNSILDRMPQSFNDHVFLFLQTWNLFIHFGDGAACTVVHAAGSPAENH